MVQIGFIGYGSMGSMLVTGMIHSGKIKQEQLIITRKDKNRLSEIKEAWPDIQVAETASEVVKQSNLVFICVKPLEYKAILEEIKPNITRDHHMISIAGSVMLSDLEHTLSCKLTKLLPTVISEVGEGISLICHNNKVSGEEAAFIEQILGSFSKVRRIEEKDFDFTSELTSVGPGLIAALFEEMLQSASRYSNNLSRENMEEMLLHTIYGTTRLMLESGMSFEEVITRVATKGGITEEGVKVLKAGLPEVFDDVFRQTMQKRSIVNDKIHKEFK